MTTVKSNSHKILYFSEEVKETFNTFLEYPCTVIEAPMGYGKTTFVTEAMESVDAEVIWQKIYDKSSGEFWAGFCQSISRIDQDCAAGLKNIGMLEDRLMSRELMKLLDTLTISKTTFLIIDDYHFVKSQSADDFLKLLILNMPENLHLVIITRISFLNNSRELQLKGFMNHIGAKSLAFTQKDIKGYYNLLGINLKKDELQELYQYSEGWVSALYLVAMDFKLHGNFVFTRNVTELTYETIYNPLDEELKYFLMSVCHLEVFSLEQAQYIWQKGNAKSLLDILLACNSLISQDKITGNYTFHNIFGMCVREQFTLLSLEIQKNIWRKVGEVQFESGQYMSAMQSFYNAEYFDGVMDALEGGDKARSIHNEHKELMIKCYRECPIDIKERHILSILFFALECVTQFREPEMFAEACRDFHICIEQNRELTNDERDQFLGEFEILHTFTSYNDMIKMGEHNAKAFKLLKSPPRFINTKDSFMFGSPSMLYLYYRASGKLIDLINFIRNAPGYYAKNTKGHGDSYRPVLEAEWLYSVGDFENAEIIVHRAIPMAKEAGQGDIELAGLFLLVKVALFRGEYSKVLELQQQMEVLVRNEVKHYQTYWLVYTLDLCKAYIYTSLEQLDQIPNWIFEYEYPKHIHFMSIAYANLTYAKALLLKGENAKLLGLEEAFSNQAGIFPNLMGIVGTKIYSSIAYYRLNRLAESREALICAMDIAMPDDVIMPFVENAGPLLPVLDDLTKDSKYRDFIKKIKAYFEQYYQSIRKIVTENFEIGTPRLTEREKQIVRLVIEGLNNKQIAKELYISENTVKLELKNIFRKLKINSRVLLKEDMIS